MTKGEPLFPVPSLIRERALDAPADTRRSVLADFFWRSNLPIHYKFSSWAYMMSYYAISVAFPL
jgi:hypothetical protein